MPSAMVTPAFEDPMPVMNGLIVEASAPTNGATVTTATVTIRS